MLMIGEATNLPSCLDSLILTTCQKNGQLEKAGRKQDTVLKLLVPEVGVEPTRPQGPRDFESRASTNFTTPAPSYRQLL